MAQQRDFWGPKDTTDGRNVSERGDSRMLGGLQAPSRKLLLALLAVAPLPLLLSHGKVDGDSMRPTLQDGQRIFGIKVGTPNRFDIVEFTAPKSEASRCIKRVIACGGEVVSIRNEKLSINGVEIAQPFNFYLGTGDIGPLTVPKDCFFVLGDNRIRSIDSRDFGVVPRQNLISWAVR